MRGVCVVGAMPPPVHGMALVNAAVRAELERSGGPVITIDISARSIGRGPLVRAGRMGVALQGIVRYFGVLVRGKTDSLYIGLSGGKGQLYELVFALLGSLFAKRVFLHHHSFAYLTSRSLLTACLLRAAGRGATNIVLCADMEESLIARYRPRGRVVRISNAAIVDSVADSAAPRGALTTAGFLGNISADKGIFDFLDVMERAERCGLALRGRIAGPFQNRAVEHAVLARCAGNASVEYLGPVYGERKAAFLQSVDVLLFPTRYANEAEPLTVLEAQLHGIPVVARARGCIASMLPAGSGLCIPAADDFVSSAIDQLTAWVNDAQGFDRARIHAKSHFESERERATPALRALCAEIASGRAHARPSDYPHGTERNVDR